MSGVVGWRLRSPSGFVVPLGRGPIFVLFVLCQLKQTESKNKQAIKKQETKQANDKNKNGSAAATLSCVGSDLHSTQAGALRCAAMACWPGGGPLRHPP